MKTSCRLITVLTVLHVVFFASAPGILAGDDCIPCERGLFPTAVEWEPPDCVTQEGCVAEAGVPTGILAEIDENFMSDALYNLFNAYKFTSSRGEIFLGDPGDPGDDDLIGYSLVEPLALHLNDRELSWPEREPGVWDEFLPLGRNADDDVYPENDDNYPDCLGNSDYLYYPLADDNETFCNGQGGYHTFAAESCPEGYFDGLSEADRASVMAMPLTDLLYELESLPGWPDEADVEDPDTGIGPGAYDMMLQYAVNLERAAHTTHSRYSFFTPGPNWLRILPPIVVIRDDSPSDPYIDLRFGMIGVYNPLGCAKWYYDEHGDRVFDDDDIKVTWGTLVVRASFALKVAGDDGQASSVPSPNELVDVQKAWETDEWVGKRVRITSGVAAGTIRPITGNTADTIDISPQTWPDLDPPAPGDNYEIISPRIVLDFPDPDTTPGAFQYLEGNLNEGLYANIEDLTIDPDWTGSAVDWHDHMETFILDREYDTFESLPIIVSQLIGFFIDDFTIPLDFLWDNIGYLDEVLGETLGVTFSTLGIDENFIDSLRFKMWEETDGPGNHVDGLIGIGVDLMGSFDEPNWEVWQTNIIPPGKGFAAMVSNELLDGIFSQLIPSTDLPRPAGEELWFDLPYVQSMPRNDPCSGDYNILERLELTELSVEVPSGGTGQPRISNLKGTVELRIPWWVYVISAAFVAAGIILIAIWIVAWLGFILLALGLFVLCAAFELDVMALEVEIFGSPPTAAIEVHYEDSWPELYANVSIPSGSVSVQEEFFPLTTILTPYLGIALDVFIDDIGAAIFPDMNMEQKLFLTAFPLSLNFIDTTIGDWLAGIAHDHKVLTDGDDTTLPSTYPDLETLRAEWRTNDLYRNMLWYLKLNHAEHFPYEFHAAGTACLPPDFYHLEAVRDGGSCSNDEILIDACANYYDDGIDASGVYELCEQYVAVCELFSSATPTEDDGIDVHREGLTIEEPDLDDLLVEIVAIFELATDCDTTEIDFLGNALIRNVTEHTAEEYREAQAALLCQSEGSYTPSPSCTPNPLAASASPYLQGLEGVAMADTNPPDGEADGLSPAQEEALEDNAKNWIQEAMNLADGADPIFENTIWDWYFGSVDDEDCDDPVAPADPVQGYWPVPFPDPDLDDDGWPRHNCQSYCDCDDFNPNVHPYATEYCNHIDDDCDGEIDEEYDKDGDGYSQCAEPVPDCDDFDPNVNPGAPEIPGNGIDDDCDGEIDEDNCFLGMLL